MLRNKISSIHAAILACFLSLISIPIGAQLIYGNTFPFWNVNGPLTVVGDTSLTGALAVVGNSALTGNLTVSGTQTTTGVQTFTAAPVVSALTASLPVCTTAGKALSSCTQTGTGTVLVAATSPSFVTSVIGGTSFDAFNTVSTTLNIGGAATTITLGAATGTTTLGNALIGSITTDSTSSTTGAFKTAGGMGVAKNLVVGAQFIVAATASPAAGDACTAGRMVWDASYVYVCTATGVWKRAALTGGY